MSQLDRVKNEIQPDQIYFDITSSNFQSKTKSPNAFQFTDVRTVPFVNCPEDYYLSIVRFSVDTGGTPVFIPSIEPNQANRDLTIYSVSLSYFNGSRTYNVREPIIWIPQDTSATLPVPPSQTFNKLQYNEDGYYYCYSYQWICYLMTLAFRRCLASLITLITDTGGILPDPAPDLQIYPPLVNWDSTANRAIMFTQSSLYDLENAGGVNLNAINVYFNSALFGLFNSFPNRFLGYDDTTYFQNYRILNVYQGGTNATSLFFQPPNTSPPTASQAVDFIQTFQEWSTVSAISPIQAIVFTSNTLPVESNQVSTPIVLSDNASLPYSNNNNSATIPIITDLVSDSGEYTGNIVYTPTAEYRLLTLYGNSPLFNIDLNIFYRIRNGSLVPFKLQSGGTVTLKLAFLKKSTRK